MKYFEFFRGGMKLSFVYHKSLPPRYRPYLMTAPSYKSQITQTE